MPHQVRAGAPYVSLDWEKVQTAMAVRCDAAGITTDAELDSKIGAMNDAQFLVFARAFFKNLLSLRQP